MLHGPELAGEITRRDMRKGEKLPLTGNELNISLEECFRGEAFLSS